MTDSSEKVPAPFVPVDLRADGLLWLINRVVFHPRGYALALHVLPDMANPERQPKVSFSLCGPGDEPWSFKAEDDDTLFVAVEAALDRARQAYLSAVEEARLAGLVDKLDGAISAAADQDQRRGRDDLTRTQRGPTS